MSFEICVSTINDPGFHLIQYQKFSTSVFYDLCPLQSLHKHLNTYAICIIYYVFSLYILVQGILIICALYVVLLHQFCAIGSLLYKLVQYLQAIDSVELEFFQIKISHLLHLQAYFNTSISRLFLIFLAQ